MDVEISLIQKSVRKAKKKKKTGTVVVSNSSGFRTRSYLATALDGIYFLSCLFSLQGSKFLEGRD